MAKVNMETLVSQISRFFPYPVINMTDLKGDYRVTLDISPDDMQAAAASLNIASTSPDAAAEPSPSITSSLRDLGLAVQAPKAPLQVVVIDHLEKMPTEN